MSEIIFGEKYISEKDRSFTVAEKKFSMSGDSFDILDSDGNKVFKADGNALMSKKMIKLLDGKECLCTVGKDKEAGGYVLKKGDTVQVLYQYKPQAGFKDSNSVSSKIEIFYGTGGAYPAYFVTRIVDDKTYVVMDAAKNTEISRITHNLKTGKRDVWTTSVPAG